MLNTNSSFWGAGQDPTPYKLAGGRLGLEYDDLQLGFSMTADRKDLEDEYGIGTIPRTRYGAYLNYSLYGFDLEAEVIKVYYDLSQDNKDSLALNPWNPKSFDKTYYHANLLYNISDYLSAYVGYDYLEGEDNMFINGGLNIYTVGASYRIIDSILLKAQYSHQTFNMYNIWEGTRNDYQLGASISF
jgi:hypothetical protein